MKRNGCIYNIAPFAYGKVGCIRQQKAQFFFKEFRRFFIVTGLTVSLVLLDIFWPSPSEQWTLRKERSGRNHLSSW